ncbi:GAF domain-containing protein [Thiomicrorhabdus aquaedulcis]|uniref:GAF domain-containing protein n=1 Tax=Thiomicrorhabdus aquaedulcis TaxID=2211106 RepID=UPI000FDA1B0E|nr:MBL fold metallo-hydrolase [Thiomicrorhabdus aquaedulcis]
MIQVLGASGSLNSNGGCSAFLVSPSVLIDAGHVMRTLGAQSQRVEHLLLTHSHFDHWVDLPFMIETYFEQRQKPLTVYGLKATLDALKTHVFNNVIWPEFHKIIHPTLGQPLVVFTELAYEQTLVIDDTEFTVINAQHTVPCCGFVIKRHGIGCVLSGDTYLTPELTARINQDPSINSLIIETSFPSTLDHIAQLSQHLTPRLLHQQLQGLTHRLDVFLYHLKPAYHDAIVREVFAQDFQDSLPVSLNKVLIEGDVLDLFNPQGISHHHLVHADYEQLNRTDTSTDKMANIMAHNNAQLEALLSIAQALSAQTNLDKLLEMILEQAIAFSNADAGTLYRTNKDHTALQFSVVRNRSLQIKMGGTAEPITWDDLPLYTDDGQPNTHMVAVLCALNKQPINIADVYTDPTFDFSGTQRFDAKTGYRSQSMLVIPMLDRDQNLLGVLQLINKTAPSHPATNALPAALVFSPQDQQNTLALASQAAISLTNALLIQEMEALFEAFIDTIAKAFDEKCSFTGNHVKQVAKLANIIAHAIDQDQHTYQDVHYDNAMFKTINLAALLHDVGKITTPEFIMQKSSKLQKIIDRIELIKHRIEILKRDAHINHLQAQVLAHTQHTPPPDEHIYQDHVRTLNDAYEFLHTMNTGNEFLAEPHAQRILELAQLTYQLGDAVVPLLDSDELTNLCIQRGTLNATERAKIMDHARVSLSMLQTLPFPKNTNAWWTLPPITTKNSTAPAIHAA